MNLEKARIKFMELQKQISAFNHATAILAWDGETFAPPGTAENTAHSIEVLNQELFALRAGKETEDLLLYLSEFKDELTVRERRTVDYMLRDVERNSRIPADEYARYEKLLAETQDAWGRAVEENNFDILCEKQREVFEYLKAFAKYSSPEIDPYEYCLDEHEEGLKIETCDQIFAAIKDHVVPLFERIRECPQVDDGPIKGNFSKEIQENLATYIMELLGLDLTRVGLASSDQPFTTFLGSHFDERIATKYDQSDYSLGLFTIMNQAGQVLYDMGQEDNLAYTVLDGMTSKFLQEAQGRLYENIIGRSRSFIEHIHHDLAEMFPDPIERYTAEDIYKAVNKVEAGFIRMDSDEVTFNIHVLIRYELEKAIMHNELDVRDLRDAWREKYKKYFGLDVKDDVNGVLQDIHWTFGGVGYFPAYALGNFYSAQMAQKMQEEVNMAGCIAEGDFDLINTWNKLRIWKYGGLYDAKLVMERFVKAPFSVEPYINYLENKYKEIYDL